MRKAKKFLLNALIVTATSLILRTLDVSFMVYVSNKIGAEGMGVFQLILSIYRLAITLAISGIELATIRLVAEELACGTHSGVKAAVKKCICYSMFFSILSATILIIGSNAIVTHWLHSKITVHTIYALALSLPFLSISCVLGGYFIAVRRVVKSSSARILEQFVKITVAIYALTLLAPKGLAYSCLALVLSGALSEFISFLYLFLLYLFDKKRYKSSSLVDKSLTRRMLNISLPVAISSYIRSGLSTYKQIMIPIGLEKSGVSCNVALAQYGIISGMVMPIIMFPSAILSAFGSLLIPEFAEKYVQKMHARINYIISRIFKTTLLFSICISGILITFSNELSMAIYKNLEAAPFIRILSPLIVAMYFDDIIDAILKSINEQVSVVRINIFDTLFCIMLLYILLPLYGIKGYLMVIFVSELFNVFFSMRRLIKVTGCQLKLLWWLVLPSIIMGTALMITKLLALSNLTIKILVAATIYLLILSAVGALRKSDFKL